MLGGLIGLLFTFHTAAQQASNNNITRSNRMSNLVLDDGWSFGLHTGAAFGLKSNETNLFRGNGFTSSLNARHFWGDFGLDFSTGFLNSALSTSAINQFIIERSLPQGSTITSAAAQNSFLLLGPTFRAGQRAQLIAAIKGGLFLNQSGSISISQQGAVRPLYSFGTGSNSVFPGFNGSLSFSYPLNTSTAIQLTSGFLQTSSSIQLFDPQRGIDIPTVQKRKVQVLTAGVSFIKTFETKSHREAGSGMASGKRTRDAGSGMASGKRIHYPATTSDDGIGDDGNSIIDPENKRVLKTKTRSNQSNDRTSQSCGPVTTKTILPDGTTEEYTFSCPDDAVNYKTKIDGGMPNRISMNVTVPKQTQGATFGEKVNQGLQTAGSHIVSGNISIRNSDNGSGGIVSNRSHGGGAGGAASAGYAATGMAVPSGGIQTSLYARETGSGMATGKRTRETGSGMATGKRQYQPFYSESNGYTCVNCVAAVAGNPIGGLTIKAGRNAGADSSRERTANAGPWQTVSVRGLAGLNVHLLDKTTGAVMSSTSTDENGDFWFANVPSGIFVVEVEGTLLSRKGYDFYIAQSDMARFDVAGEVVTGNDVLEITFDKPGEATGQLKFNHNSVRSNKSTIKDDGGNDSDALQQKANINTSRSNTKGIIVIGTDSDGDGVADRFTVTGRLSDGSSAPVTDVIVRKKADGTSEVRITFDPPPAQRANINTSRSNVKNATITIGPGTTDLTVQATFRDGTNRNATSLAETVSSPGLIQVSIELGDSDGDGQPDFIWSPRSNVAVTSQSETTTRSSLPATAFEGSKAFVKAIPVYFNLENSAGEPSLYAGNQGSPSIPGPLAKPGNPIGGLTIKGGRNPGGNIQQKRTNNLGEFEFTNLEPGNYRITAEYSVYINDQTIIEVGSDQEPLAAGKQTQGATFGERVSAGKIQVNSLIQTLLEAEDLLNKDSGTNRTGINTSRSNIKNVQNALFDLQRALNSENVAEMQVKAAAVDVQLQMLQASLQSLDSRYSSISNVLKTKHDTVKNSINNVR